MTAGDDKTLKIFDLEKRELITETLLPDSARSVATSPNGNLIAVGLSSGGVS